MPLNFDGVLRLEQPSVVPSAQGPAGLALSGGGIRSATFSLGVLQALAAHGKLASFDYLSTVSGGGYIGGWLSAWVHRTSLNYVQAELAKPCGNSAGAPASVEHSAITWLRRYSNYLSPRVGLLTIDAITILTTWIRNVLLNLIILVALFSALTLAPRLALPQVQAILSDRDVAQREMVISLVALGIMIIAMVMNFFHGQGKRDSWSWFTSTQGVVLTVLTPGWVAACSASLWLFGTSANHIFSFSIILLGVLLGISLLWLLFAVLRGAYRRKIPGEPANFAQEATALILGGVVCMAATVGLLFLAKAGYIAAAPADLTHQSVIVFTFGPTAFLVLFGVVGSIYVGIVGRGYAERSREWWSRMNACFLVAGSGWLILMGCAFYVPALVDWAIANSGTYLKALTSTGWLGAALGVLFSPKFGVISDKARVWLMSVVNVLAIALMLSFVIGTACLTDAALNKVVELHHPSNNAAVEQRRSARPSQSEAKERATWRATTQPARLETIVNRHMAQLTDALAGGHIAPALLAMLLVLGLFGWRVDVNIFSLHNMYKSRLIRCYLGASRARKANLFTGFDEDDDLVFAKLTDQQGRVQRPIHIFNTSLNLSQGKNLAWQERKAASFILTPQVCGFQLSKTQGDTCQEGGYRPTREYGRRGTDCDGLSLGTAMATSGAALSPNMGLASKPALAFVLTVFNIRLGRWSANPTGKAWRNASPTIGLLALLSELLGFSNETSDFVYLSDGGHFDNTGIYELVRRRCKTIVVVDAGADGARRFEDIGRAIRHCRVDFGVEITIDLTPMRKVGDRLPQAGFCRGTIEYNDGTGSGIILCIKPTLCAAADEPTDILEYRERNPAFPHQAAADQYFNESQFESYRLLGRHIGNACLACHADSLTSAALLPSPTREIKPRPIAVDVELIKMLSVFGAIFAFALIGMDMVDMRETEVFYLVAVLFVPVYSSVFYLQYRLLAANAGKLQRKYWSAPLMVVGTTLVVVGAVCNALEIFSNWKSITGAPDSPGLFNYSDIGLTILIINLMGSAALLGFGMRRRSGP